jgi:hypothetical protein
MGRLLYTGFAAVVLFAVASTAEAQIQPYHQYKFSGVNHLGHRGHPGYGGHYYRRGASFSFSFGGGYPYSYGGYAAYPYYFGPDYYYGYYPRTTYYVPPIVVPAETWFGPQAVKRFLGLDQVGPVVAPQIAAPEVIVPAQPAAPPVPAPPEVILGEPDPAPAVDRARANAPPAREANAAAQARALQFIEFGDRWFAEQRFHEALQRYKRAVDAAPDSAEAFFRQGFAYAALGLYDRAAFAFRRGLSLDAGWPQTDFAVDDLYGANRVAKRAHRETVALAAVENPEDGDLLFVLGVLLHFDDQADRAQTFFRRAAELADQADHLTPFLAQAGAGRAM